MIPRALWPWLAAAGLALLCWLAWARILDRRDTGADAVDRATIERETTSLQQIRLDTIVVEKIIYRDTTALRGVETRYRTLRDTLKLTDTVAVFRAFQLTDTLARACRAALISAEDGRSLCEAKARALTAQRDAYRRLSERPGPRVETSLSALYDFRDRAPVAQAEVELRLVGRLSAIGALSHQFSPHESPRLQFGARYTF